MRRFLLREELLKPPRAIAFDLDGTLIDSRGDIAAACNHALGATGRSGLPEAIIAGFVGEGARVLCARAAGLAEHDPAVDPVLDAFMAYYLRHPCEHTRWMPGAPETLAALGSYPLAVCTNKPRAVTLPVLAALGVSGRFACVIAGGDTPERKPAPSPLLAVARALGVAPGDLWLVGDSPIDVETGRAAGSPTVAVEGGFATRAALVASCPDALLTRLDELIALVGSSGLAPG